MYFHPCGKGRHRLYVIINMGFWGGGGFSSRGGKQLVPKFKGGGHCEMDHCEMHHGWHDIVQNLFICMCIYA